MANTTNGKSLPGPRAGIQKWVKDSRAARMRKNEAMKNTLGHNIERVLPINYSANKYKKSY